MRRLIFYLVLLLAWGCTDARAQQLIGSVPRAGGLPAAVVAWYDMDESSGDALDSVGSNDLTDNNSVSAQTAGNCVVGTCREFADEDLDPHFSSTASVHDMDQEFAVCGWFYVASTGVSSSQVLVGSNTTGDANPTLSIFRLNSTDDLQLTYFDSGDNFGSITGVETINDNTWYFICFGFDPDSDVVWFEVNAGTQRTTAETDSALRTWLVSRVATRNGTTQMLEGRVDELVWMNDTPSSTFIDCLYNSGSGRSLSDATTNCTTF